MKFTFLYMEKKKQLLHLVHRFVWIVEKEHLLQKKLMDNGLQKTILNVHIILMEQILLTIDL